MTIRPSHYAYIANKGTKHAIRVSLLYDQGATLCQIRNCVAEKAGLKPVNTIKALMMKTAGRDESENWGESNLYNIPSHDSNGTLATIVHCVGVDHIGNLDNGSYQGAAQLFEPDGLVESQLLEPASGVIDVLIGNNHAGAFPTVIKVCGNTVWAETRFGHILHGSNLEFFPAQTSAQGLLMSTALDAYANKSAQCLLNSLRITDVVSDPSNNSTSNQTVKPGELQVVKTSETARVTAVCKSEPVSVHCTSTSVLSQKATIGQELQTAETAETAPAFTVKARSPRGSSDVSNE